MENPIANKDYEIVEKEARELYGKVGQIWCPALNDRVVFNGMGFRHLLWKGEKPRPKKERERRFALLLHAESILADSHAPIVFRKELRLRKTKKHGKKVQKLSEAKFWALSGVRGGETITVVLRQIDKGKKHFLSIF